MGDSTVRSSLAQDAEVRAAVEAALATIADSAPGALDSLDEIAAVLRAKPDCVADLVDEITTNVVDSIDDTAARETEREVEARPHTAGAMRMTQPGLSAWFMALEHMATTPVDVVVIADSIASFGSQAFVWPGKVQTHLAALFNERATTRWFPVAPGEPVPRWNGTVNGAPTETGFGGYAVALADGDVANHTATCDQIEILYTTQTLAGELHIHIDGTLVDTISTGGDRKSSNRWLSDGLDFVSHALQVVGSVGDGKLTPILEGAMFHAGTATAGVRVWNGGHIGYASADFLRSPGVGLDLIEALHPDLVIVATGINDKGDDLPDLVAEVQARTTGALAVWVPYQTRGKTRSEWVANKVEPARAAAANAGAATIDTFALIGSVRSENDPWSLSSDGRHPTHGCSALIATQVLGTILGDPIGAALSAFLQSGRDYRGSFHGPLVYDPPTGGRFQISQLLGPFVALFDDPTDTGVAVQLLASQLAEALGQPGPGLALGPGGSTVVDTFITRAAPGIARVPTLELSGVTEPNAPMGNHARLYVDTAGAKDRLMIRFTSGASQEIAAEPD